MAKVSRKEVREIIAYAESFGFQLEGFNGRGHWILRIPGGPRLTVSATPSSPSAWRNAKADIKRKARQHEQQQKG